MPVSLGHLTKVMLLDKFEKRILRSILGQSSMAECGEEEMQSYMNSYDNMNISFFLRKQRLKLLGHMLECKKDGRQKECTKPLRME